MTVSLYKISLKPGEEGDFRKAVGRLDEEAFKGMGFHAAHVFFTMNEVWLYFDTAREGGPVDLLKRSERGSKLYRALAEHAVFDEAHPERHRLDLRRTNRAEAPGREATP